MLRPQPRPVEILLGIVVLLLIGVPSERFFDDPGLGWHLRAGNVMSQTGEVLRVDPFLAGYHERSWIHDQWFSDVLLWRLFHVNGWNGLYGTLYAVFTLATFVIPFVVSRYRGFSLVASVFGGVIAYKLGLVHAIARPVVFSFLLFSLMLLMLARVRRHDAVPATVPLWSIPVTGALFAVWANLHPSFVVGLGILWIFLLAVFIRDATLSGQVGGVARRWPRVVGLAVVSAGATLLNPYGVDLHESIISLGQSEYFMSLNAEWRALNLAAVEGEQVLISILLVVSGWAVTGRLRRHGIFDVAGVVLLAAASFHSVRFLPYFGIFIAPLIAASVDRLYSRLVWRRSPVFLSFFRLLSPPWIRRRLVGSGVYGACTAVVLFGLSTWWGFAFPWSSGVPQGPSSTRYPFGAMSFLSASVPQGATILSHPDWGGFIAWKGDGRLRPVIDDRNTLLGEAWYRATFEALRPSSTWREFARRVGARYLLLPVGAELAPYVEDTLGIPPVYRDSIAVLFEVDL